MSHLATAVEPTSQSVAILGADALLVALPSTPTQLANACFAGGFAEVFPATWGDELIAAGCLEQLESRTGPAIFCSCPLVAEQLRGAVELRRFIVPLISPPVAVARYLRALYADHALTITYIGDCPGAYDESIDERLSPHELLAHLAKRGILPATQRPDLGAHAAHDRRRFYSLPGGVPSPQWLGAQWPKRTLVDVHAGDALAGLANQTLTRGNTLIDFAPHLGCACAGAVGGTSAHDARKAVVALEPPRAQSEIVSAAVHVEVSLAPAGDRHLAEVSWNDFLAALPAALAMPADGAPALPDAASRALSRRGREKKALPRAYLAARQGAHRDRQAPAPVRATVVPAHEPRAHAVPPAAESRGASLDADTVHRDDMASMRPNPWAARRASQEGMTGPRGQATHRAPLAPADRWLLAGLVIAGSFLVAVLTSALTVRGIQQTGAPMVAARSESVVAVASVPPVAARDSVIPARAARAPDSVAFASSTPLNDSAPQHEDGGTVAAPPPAAPRLSPLPPVHPARTARRDASRAERHPLSIAEHAREVPPALAGPARQLTRVPASSSPAQPTSSANISSSMTAAPAPAGLSRIIIPASSAPPAAATSTRGGSAAPTAAPATVTNAQFLEELRAIRAEIDARKRRMDSLARSLDSLRHVAPPR